MRLLSIFWKKSTIAKLSYHYLSNVEQFSFVIVSWSSWDFEMFLTINSENLFEYLSHFTEIFYLSFSQFFLRNFLKYFFYIQRNLVINFMQNICSLNGIYNEVSLYLKEKYLEGTVTLSDELLEISYICRKHPKIVWKCLTWLSPRITLSKYFKSSTSIPP